MWIDFVFKLCLIDVMICYLGEGFALNKRNKKCINMGAIMSHNGHYVQIAMLSDICTISTCNRHIIS